MACQRKTLEKWLLLQFRIKILSHLTIVSLWHNRCTGSPKTHWGDQRFMHATMARSSSSSFQSHIESARQPFFYPHFFTYLTLGNAILKCHMVHFILEKKYQSSLHFDMAIWLLFNVLPSCIRIFIVSILKIKLRKNQFGLDQIIGSFGAN